MMDCQEVEELLDAYVLGALERDEAQSLEEHVAGCLRCWDKLKEGQRVAALLALATSSESVNPLLRRRVLDRARIGESWQRIRAALPSLSRLGPVTAGALTAFAAAALTLGIVLQTRMNDLNQETNSLQQQLLAADTTLTQQQQMLTILSMPDTRSTVLKPGDGQPKMTAIYYWSEALQSGGLSCDKLLPLRPGETYQLWLLFGNQAVSAGTFSTWKGTCLHTFDFQSLQLTRKPTGVAVSIEPAGGSARPTGQFTLLNTFPEE